MPIEWVRVKDPDTGHEITISAAQAQAVGARELSSRDALTAFGEPIPVKYRTSVDEAAAKKAAASEKGA